MAPRGRCPRCGELVRNPNWRTATKRQEPLLIRCIWALGPNYDELSAFLTGGAFVLTILANASKILTFLKSSRPISPVSAIVIMVHPVTAIPLWAFIFGMIFSLYHVFSKRIKKPIEKIVMTFFTVTINVITGIVAGIYMLRQQSMNNKQWLYVFPIWAFMNSAIIWIKFSSCKNISDLIADENASLGEAVFGLVTLLTVFCLCHFVFGLEWPFTLSICVVYATCFSKGFGDVFLGKKASEQPAGANDK